MSPTPWWAATLLAIAVMLVGLGSASIAVVSAVYDGRIERTGARAPVLVDGQPSFLFTHASGTVGLAPMAVTFLEPLSADAPLPPGVRSWPEPGQAWVSPALVGEDVIERQYGTVVGIIGQEGLGSPTERLIYARPASGAELTAGMEGADAYGRGFSLEPGSEQLNVKPAWLLWLFIALFVLCPSAVLLGVAVLSGARSRAHELARLEILGASPRLLMRIVIGTITIPILLGAASSLGMIALGCLVNLPLPGYAISHADMRSQIATILAAWAAGILLATCACTALSYPRPPRAGNRPQEKNPRYRGWVAVSGGMGIVGCGYLGIMEAQAQNSGVALYALIGTVTIVTFTPFILGWVLRWAATAMARSGWARGRTGALVAGRDLQVGLRAGARLAAVNAVIVFTVTQASMFTLLGTSEAAFAEAMYRAVDGKGAMIDVPHDATANQIERVRTALPDGNTSIMIDSYLRIVGSESSFEAVLTASPKDLNLLGLTPGETDPLTLPEPLFTLASADTIQRMTVVASDSPGGHPADGADDLVSRSLAVIATGTPVDVVSIQGAVNRTIAPGWSVEIPGDGWRVGAWIAAHQSRWVGFTGSIGAVVLLAAVWLRALDNNRESTRRLGVLSAALGGEKIARAASGWRIAVTTGLGVACGALIAWQYSGMITAMGAGIDPPYGLLATLCAIALSMGVLVWLTSIYDSRRAMTAWRPGQDHS